MKLIGGERGLVGRETLALMLALSRTVAGLNLKPRKSRVEKIFEKASLIERCFSIKAMGACRLAA